MKVINNNRFFLFMRDYRLPFLSTCCFVLIIILLLLLRFYEQTTLANVLGSKSSTDSGFSSLLSKDKDAELSKDDIGSEIANKKDSGVTIAQAPLALTTTTQTGGNTTNTGGNQPPPTGGGTGGVDTPPPAPGPFTAQISGFSLRGKSLPFLCGSQTGGSFGPGQYCINYHFGTAISTSDGPGVVEYKLMQNGPEENVYPGSFQAPQGDTINPIGFTVKLSCDLQGPYLFHLELISPNVQSSQDVPVDHNCSTSLTGP